MMISTKGRYALRVLIDLARHAEEGAVSLRDVAARQEISLKYLESIVAALNKGGLVTSTRGASGGYRLALPAAQITVSRVITLTEGSLAPVGCIENGACTCGRADQCATLPMWQHLDALIDDYLSGITVEDLACGRVKE